VEKHREHEERVVPVAVGRTVLAPTELPVGIVTAVCGAPVFLAVLFRRR
jgi:iron complex transport system permease protein